MKLSDKHVLVAMVIASIFLSGCNDAKTTIQAALPNVDTLVMQEVPITPYYTFIGRTLSANDVDIKPRVDGELVAIHFKDGDMVKKGQLLYEIDPRPYQAALDFANANLKKALAEQALADREAKRMTKLLRDKSVSEQQYDDALANQKTAIASVAAAQSSIESAALDLEFSSIRAPFDGRVGFSNYHIGDRIGVLQVQPMLSIAQIDPIRFKFSVDEKLYRQVRSLIDAQQQDTSSAVELSLTLSDDSVYPQKGKIYAVGNKINLETGAIEVEASFDNPDYALMPGEFGNLMLKVQGQTTKGLLVPASAVQQDQAGDYVMVVDQEGTANRRDVVLGQSYNTDRAVVSGLSAGDKVIVNGLQKVRAGIKVQESDESH
ncbi:efflux RND transporter periplasmic adaptor subunit [Shewanella sp. A25]|nr:efflux RND transporter periplasmic adaptor subunit [Shewanella shenzhenensis]